MIDDTASNLGQKSPFKGSEDLLDVLTTYEEGDLGDGGQLLLAGLAERLNGFMLDMKEFCTVVI